MAVVPVVPVSFVIPAHNEEQLLGRTLAAIHASARALDLDYEVVVADDASTDGTCEVARQAGARVVTVSRRQISAARNAGARAARGDVLIFVDADTLVNDKVLKATLDAVAAGAVGGGAHLAFDGPVRLSARFAAAVILLAMRLTRLAAGAYLFATRKAFDATGGFDETLYATEELTFSRALQRVGPVVILREHAVTSGRKARTHSAWELLSPLVLFVRYGFGVRRRRDGLALWYGERRHDPHGPDGRG